jgi:hypothetical protein
MLCLSHAPVDVQCLCRAGRITATCIADHQPPNKMIKLAKEARGLRGWLLRSWPNAMVQRFYPHCEHCSQLQAGAMRQGRDGMKAVLVWHSWLRRQPQLLLAGALLGYMNAAGGVG